MKTIKIGESIITSRLSYGCMRIGSKTQAEAEKVVKTALEIGINFFDNADIYCAGKSEEFFGNAVKNIDRESIYIQSKCGIRKGFYDFSKEHIISSAENSIKRIGCEYLDVLCLHRPDVLMEGEEVAQAFDNLHSRGLVRNFGVSNFNPMQIELLKKYIDYPLVANQLQLGIFHTGMIDSGMCANMKNDFSADKDGSVLPYSQLNDMVIQAWGPLRSRNGFFPTDASVADKAEILDREAKEIGISKEALSIAFISRIHNVQPILGTTDSERLRSLAESEKVELSRQKWYELYKEMGNIVP
ncbi:MAG: aldo/keto reductase [Eubacterium sp.]|nr:aldo/keto reductase [Eubacterium sp.]